MEHLNPIEDPDTANFTVTAPEDDDSEPSASSDQGNVSWFLPSIQTGFPVGGTAPVHNAGFRELAGTVSQTKTIHDKAFADLSRTSLTNRLSRQLRYLH